MINLGTTKGDLTGFFLLFALQYVAALYNNGWWMLNVYICVCPDWISQQNKIYAF